MQMCARCPVCHFGVEVMRARARPRVAFRAATGCLLGTVGGRLCACKSGPTLRSRRGCARAQDRTLRVLHGPGVCVRQRGQHAGPHPVPASVFAGPCRRRPPRRRAAGRRPRRPPARLRSRTAGPATRGMRPPCGPTQVSAARTWRGFQQRPPRGIAEIDGGVGCSKNSQTPQRRCLVSLGVHLPQPLK